MRKALLALSLAWMLLSNARVVHAQIGNGCGTVYPCQVYDSPAVGQLIKDVSNSLILIGLAKQAALNLQGRGSWQTVFPGLYELKYLVDHFGNAAAWQTVVNFGGNPSVAYQQATVPITAYPTYTNVNAVHRLKAGTAGVELSDGALQSAMQTIGAARGHAGVIDAATSSLESSVYGGGIATQEQTLQSISGAAMLTAKTTNETNRLTLTTAELTAMKLKKERDEQAEALSTNAAGQQNPTSTQTAVGSLGSQVQNFDFPD